MLPIILRIVGSVVIAGWGVAHILLVRSITRGFGSLSPESRRIVSSTWISEGLPLIFVGALEGLATYYGSLGGGLENQITRASAGMLLAFAPIDVATKARNVHIAMRLCPILLTLVSERSSRRRSCPTSGRRRTRMKSPLAIMEPSWRS